VACPPGAIAGSRRIPPARAMPHAVKQKRRSCGHLLAHYQAVRARSLALTEDLSAEDLCLQAMPDASPGKWHLGHTSWFFEVVVLQALNPCHVPMDSRLAGLFNSYYLSLSHPFPRAQRGLLSRPDLNTVHRYRQHVDHAMVKLLAQHPNEDWQRVAWLTELGLAHEAQHQELMLTDLLALFAANPLQPTACPNHPMPPSSQHTPLTWMHVPQGTYDIGQDDTDFAFDHERPRHPVMLRSMAMANRPVSNAEFKAFIDDRGYQRHEFWSSAGWEQVRAHGWHAPLYWLGDGRAFTLQGPQPLEPHASVCHVSLHEACAYAAWADARLPTEAEWEAWWQWNRPSINTTTGVGTVWEWTSSAFGPYPGYKPWPGTLTEYNSKFMVDQAVLRGASWATPRWSQRGTCRNFFHAHARWQFSGIRLARDT